DFDSCTRCTITVSARWAEWDSVAGESGRPASNSNSRRGIESMKRIKRIRWLLLGIVAAAWILFVVWPRPKLVWYTTPVLTNGEYSGRVRLLIPAGWKYQFNGYGRNTGDGRVIRIGPVDK